MNYKTLLITWGAGFIGSNFVVNFLESNPDTNLINLDLMTYAGDKANLLEVEGNSRYTFIKGDICDYNLINKTYIHNKVNYVKHDPENFNNIQSKVILDNFESLEYPGQHDGEKLVKTILQISNLLYEK